MLNFLKRCENCHNMHVIFCEGNPYPFDLFCDAHDFNCFRVFCHKTEQQLTLTPECKERRVFRPQDEPV